MNTHRLQKISELIQVEVSKIILEELKDPRIGFVTIIGVEVSADLKYAKISVSVYGNEQNKKDTMAGLQSAKGFIRRDLAKKISLRYIPEISFEFDDSLEKGARIFELLNKIKKENGKDS